MERIQNSHVRNLWKVNDGLWRGGQPDEEGFRELQKMGIKTVICLRFRTSLIDWERGVCEKLGLQFLSIPLNYTTTPRSPQIERFFDMVDEATNQPVYVHCYHGSDRTGLMLGIFRIARDGWTFKDAYIEMKACGFHRFRIRPFKWCLSQYYNSYMSERKKEELAAQMQQVSDESLTSSRVENTG